MFHLPDHLNKHFEAGQRLRSKGYRGRFAPSPTGPLHLGNLRTALLSWLQARLAGGTWLLRIDDLDTHRNRPGACELVQKDLLWMGLYWDGPVILQSLRKGIYYSVLSALRRENKLYACRCSRRILINNFVHKGIHDAIYPGTCKNKNLGWGLYEDKLPSWRLRVDKGFKETCGDVILRRADGFVAYHLASAVDELTLGINEVVRGEDLAGSKVSQLAVIRSISQPFVIYKHAPLLLDLNGRKLSKRNMQVGLGSFKEQGKKAPHLIGLLAASLDLVPHGSILTSSELLSDLKNRKNDFKNCLKS